jgi:hypothetical protein
MEPLNKQSTGGLGMQAARGQPLTFRLTITELAIDQTQYSTWGGHAELLLFPVEVPAKHRPGTVTASLNVQQAGVPVGTIEFPLEILSGGQIVEAVPVGVATRAKP